MSEKLKNIFFEKNNVFQNKNLYVATFLDICYKMTCFPTDDHEKNQIY